VQGAGKGKKGRFGERFTGGNHGKNYGNTEKKTQAKQVRRTKKPPSYVTVTRKQASTEEKVGPGTTSMLRRQEKLLYIDLERAS